LILFGGETACIDSESSQTLGDVIVQFTGEPGAFRLLRLEQPPTKLAHRSFRLFPLGDVPD